MRNPAGRRADSDHREPITSGRHSNPETNTSQSC